MQELHGLSSFEFSGVNPIREQISAAADEVDVAVNLQA